MLTKNPLVNQILFDRNFDISEILKRSSSFVPKGDITLALYMKPRTGRKMRMYLIKNDNDFICLSQLQINRFQGQRIQLVNDIIRYRSEEKIQPYIMDAKSPFFNIEWNFEISKEVYENIFKELSKINIPVLESRSGLDGSSRELLLNHSGGFIHVGWWEDYEPYSELTQYFDELLGIALTKIKTAYLRKIVW